MLKMCKDDSCLLQLELSTITVLFNLIKEFKFNPNAKSFVPLQSPLRPASPVSDGSFYYPPNVGPVSQMQSMGLGTSFTPHQPVMYGPQTTSYQSQQSYYQPNVPQLRNVTCRLEKVV